MGDPRRAPETRTREDECHPCGWTKGPDTLCLSPVVLGPTPLTSPPPGHGRASSGVSGVLTVVVGLTHDRGRREEGRRMCPPRPRPPDLSLIPRVHTPVLRSVLDRVVPTVLSTTLLDLRRSCSRRFWCARRGVGRDHTEPVVTTRVGITSCGHVPGRGFPIDTAVESPGESSVSVGTDGGPERRRRGGRPGDGVRNQTKRSHYDRPSLDRPGSESVLVYGYRSCARPGLGSRCGPVSRTRTYRSRRAQSPMAPGPVRGRGGREPVSYPRLSEYPEEEGTC